MKPRNREINIFNMSLLDILCGALGTFCFLMLVLFPFYSQDKGQAKAPEIPKQEIDPKTYDQAMARIKQLEDTLKQFQDYAAQLEAKMKQMTAQSHEAQAEASELREKNQQLVIRNPIVAVASFAFQEGNSIEVWEDDNCASQTGHQHPKLDVTQVQGPNWTGDRSSYGPSLSLYTIRDAPSCQFTFYIKVLKHNTAGPPMTGFGVVQTEGDFKGTPLIYNTREKVAIPFAVVTVAQDLKQTVQIVVPKENLVPPAQSQSPGSPFPAR